MQSENLYNSQIANTVKWCFIPFSLAEKEEKTVPIFDKQGVQMWEKAPTKDDVLEKLEEGMVLGVSCDEYLLYLPVLIGDHIDDSLYFLGESEDPDEAFFVMLYIPENAHPHDVNSDHHVRYALSYPVPPEEYFLKECRTERYHLGLRIGDGVFVSIEENI